MVLLTSHATDRLKCNEETHSTRSSILSCASTRLFHCQNSPANALEFVWQGSGYRTYLSLPARFALLRVVACVSLALIDMESNLCCVKVVIEFVEAGR